MKTLILAVLAISAQAQTQPPPIATNPFVITDQSHPFVMSGGGNPIIKIYALTCNVPWPQTLRIGEGRFYLPAGSTTIMSVTAPWTVFVGSQGALQFSIENAVPTTCFLTWSY